MTIETMNIDRDFSVASSASASSFIESPRILSAFADLLYKFKQNAEETDLLSIVKGFKEIATNELLNLEESESPVGVIGCQSDVLENWALEIKFWSLIEILINYRYSDEYNESSELDIKETTSHVAIKEHILQNNNKLRELDLLSFWLVYNLALEDDDPSFNQDELPSTKWLNTKIDLQSSTNRPDLVASLDPDAKLSWKQAQGKRSKKINEADAKNDEVFFKQVFKLLLEEKHEDIMQLCEATNNWTLSSIMAGAHDYMDPEADSSFLRNDDEDQSVENSDSLKPSGIKNKILWRKTVYALSTNPKLGKYERAVYSYLSGDYVEYELTDSWERALLIFTNNMLQYDLEESLVSKIKPFGNPDLSKVLKMSKPEKKFDTVNEALNFLSKSASPAIRKQSQHSIRVLIGSIITNNVAALIKNAIKLLGDLILVNDDYRNESHLDTKRSNNLIKESYLLRILIHFIIFMKFLDDTIINDDDLVKLIKIYITRLSLYKLYDLIPIYISYIPSHAEIVENYSFFISNVIVDQQDRAAQLTHMRNLELPLEEIVTRSIERVLEDTDNYYQVDGSAVQRINERDITKLDTKLISAFNCLIDAKMYFEAVDTLIKLSRKFGSTGRLHALVGLYGSFDLNNLMNEYKIQNDLHEEYNIHENAVIDARLKAEEVSQYSLLLEVSRSVESCDQDVSQQAVPAVKAISKLMTTWLSASIKLTDNSDDLSVYEHLRSLYIPYLLFKVLNVFKTAQNKELLREFRNIVNLVSSEEYRIYQMLINAGCLEDLLRTVSEVSISAAVASDHGIYA